MCADIGYNAPKNAKEEKDLLMSQVWFTADTHFGHRRIPLYTQRRFCFNEEENSQLDQWLASEGHHWQPSWEAIAKMDQYLIDKINYHVRPEDVLWHLGDFCFGPRNSTIVEHARRYRERINCRTINFVFGNHDNRLIGQVFNRNYDHYELKWRNKHIVMCHYAHAVWNRSHHGAWMLYGHSHTNAEEWLDKAMPGRRSIDVGVDNAYKILGEYRPFSFDELDQLLSCRTGCCVDHHKEN